MEGLVAFKASCTSSPQLCVTVHHRLGRLGLGGIAARLSVEQGGAWRCLGELPGVYYRKDSPKPTMAKIHNGEVL